MAFAYSRGSNQSVPLGPPRTPRQQRRYDRRYLIRSVRNKPVNLNRGMANLAPYSRAPKGTDQLPPLQVAKLTRRLVKAKQGFRSNTDLPGSGLSASGPIQGSVSNNPYLSRIKTLRGRLAGQRPPGQKPEGPPRRQMIFPPDAQNRQVKPRGRGQFGGNFNAQAGYGRRRRNSRFRPPLS